MGEGLDKLPGPSRLTAGLQGKHGRVPWNAWSTLITLSAGHAVILAHVMQGQTGMLAYQVYIQALNILNVWA